MRLLTKEQSSRLDKYSINKYNISQDLLMKSAANHCADEIIKYLLKNQRLKKILIICGKGNNGGDAIYTAKLLQKENLDIHVHFLIEKNEIQGLSLKYHNQYTKANGSISYGYKLTKYKNIDVIVDGILGIGFKGSLRPEIINWVKWINSLKVYIIALDLPSGLNADNGVVLPVAIKASQTITFGYGKIGLYINEGKDYSGIIKTVDIGLNKKVLFELGGFECHLYNSKTPKQFLNNVPNNTYKQKRGKVLIIGGSVGMTGAAVLATYGSLRVGAGVVITVCPSSLSNIYEKYILEGMTLACEDDGRGYLSIKNYDIIMNKVDWADSIVIGPGLGLNNSTKTLVAKLIKSIQKPIVIDADALNGFNKFMLDSSNMVITPHLGEFSKIV